MRILVAHRERKVAGFLELALREDGYAVDVAFTDKAVTDRWRTIHYDAVVLDTALPPGGGLSLVKQLRRDGGTTPVLVLADGGTRSGAVAAFDAGADGYLAAPFALAELLARLRALVRRAPASARPRMEYGPVRMEPGTYRVTVLGSPLELTTKQFDLLSCLMRHAGRIVSLTEIAREVWHMPPQRGKAAVRACMATLRRQLQVAGGRHLIRTVRGMGYGLAVEDPLRGRTPAPSRGHQHGRAAPDHAPRGARAPHRRRPPE